MNDQTYQVFKDGSSWCAVGADFINLQESDAGFGSTPVEALEDLLDIEASREQL
jgi:hypothetical protein